MERLFPRLPGVGGYRTRLQDITRTSNTLLFQVVEEIAAFYETSAPHDWSAKALRERRGGFVHAFLSERDEFVYRNQDILLEALRGSNAQVEAALA